jgi:hypothetical protein
MCGRMPPSDLLHSVIVWAFEAKEGVGDGEENWRGEDGGGKTFGR